MTARSAAPQASQWIKAAFWAPLSSHNPPGASLSDRTWPQIEPGSSPRWRPRLLVRPIHHGSLNAALLDAGGPIGRFVVEPLQIGDVSVGKRHRVARRPAPKPTRSPGRPPGRRRRQGHASAPWIFLLAAELSQLVTGQCRRHLPTCHATSCCGSLFTRVAH